MTSRFVWFSRVFSVLFSFSAALAKGVGRGARRVLRAVWEYILLSGRYPSLTRDPGIAAYRLLEGHPRRSRPFRGAERSAVAEIADEPHLRCAAFL
jgi:hypothetical protein